MTRKSAGSQPMSSMPRHWRNCRRETSGSHTPAHQAGTPRDGLRYGQIYMAESRTAQRPYSSQSATISAVIHPTSFTTTGNRPCAPRTPRALPHYAPRPRWLTSSQWPTEDVLTRWESTHTTRHSSSSTATLVSTAHSHSQGHSGDSLAPCHSLTSVLIPTGRAMNCRTMRGTPRLRSLMTL